jgi:Na+-driven multidrug efflux pump
MTGFLIFLKIIAVLDQRLIELGEALPLYTAGSKIIIDIMSITFMSAIAFGMATTTLVSQNLGSNTPELASRYGWESVKIGLYFFGVLGILMAFFPELPLRIFTQAQKVIQVSKPCMSIMAACAGLMAVGLILTQALFGAGDMKFVMYAQLLLQFFLFLPLAYVLGIFFRLNMKGVWIATAIYVIILTFVMGVKFKAKGWQRIIV